ncbi:MAG: M24 family metallopeptidase, partial [Bacteroidota bacterium]
EIYLAIYQLAPEAEFIDAFEIVNDLRRLKSKEEITFLQRSAFIADVGMAALIEYVRPGVSINQCIQVVDNAMVAAGATANGFLNIGGGTFPDQMELSFRGSPYRFQSGDIVTNALTSEYKGYYTQLSRPISLGREPNEDFKMITKVNEEVYNLLFSKFRAGAQIREGLDVQGNNLAQAISDGEWVSPFSCQSTEIEQFSYQNNVALQPGISYMLMPWLCKSTDWDGVNYFPTPGNWVGHVWGNTIICQEEEPLVLHQTPMDVVVKTDFQEVLSVPSLPRDPIHGPGGTWKVSFAIPGGMQEKEIRTTESGAFMDGKPIPFTFDDGAVEFELTVGTPRGPIPLTFKGWMIGDEIAGAYQSKAGAVKGQRNRFKAIR